MYHNSLKYCIILALSSIFFVDSLSAAPTAEAGKTLFQNQCASCHNKNMKDNLTGPALGGVEGRWASFPKEDLYNWIRNSQSMISKGHPRATELWGKFKPTVMSSFPAFTDEDIASILLFVDAQFNKVPAAAGPVQ